MASSSCRHSPYRRFCTLLVLVLAHFAVSRVASAQEEQHEHPSPLDRPHTVAELEVGIIALPNAPISNAYQGGSTPFGAVGNGDATLQTGLHLIYRATREWAIGAGALFAPSPTTDNNYGGGTSNLQRAHSRSYLLLGAEGRYFPFRSRWFEAWFGLTGGLVIIADRFTTNAGPQVPSILGNNTTSVGTEGFAAGVEAGADYLITDQWALGLTLRGDQWILPGQQSYLGFLGRKTSCDAIGDCATLSGSVQAFEVGVTIGYRIPL
jgi:hypothetical protein